MNSGASVRQRALFASGVLLGLVAEQVILFAVPLLIFQDTGEVSTLGFAFALEWLPGLLAYPFAGLLADRDGGARLFTRVSLLRALILLTVLLVCLAEPGAATVALMAGGACLSVCMAPIRMSIEKMVPQLAPPSQVAAVQSLVQNMELLAMALGPALATVAALFLGKLWLLLVAAAAFAIAAATWLPLPRPRREPAVRQAARAVLAELAIGWRLLVSIRPVLLLGVLNFAINLVVGVLLAANAALITDVFRAPDSAYGLLNTAVGIMGLLNLLLIPILLRRFGIGLVGVTGFALICAALLVAAFAPSYLVYAPAFVAVIVGAALYNVYNRTQRLKVIPGEHLGKVMGPFYLLNLVSYPIAGLMIGGVGASVGPQRLVLWLSALLCLFGAVLLPLTMAAFRKALQPREIATVEVEA
ncbi:H+ Antiporter protein [Nocardia otitidiscaviarum]|uniref:Multidrug efflux pump Tap n=1 Tax=Nocardia otitidiscaviarum TaxID=1823 RepID=A0A378YMK9_9NOCA|nr:MFS transporter [Nocardia otitidiscaviarum]MBF6181910.1 MFS transporter [Nocardia otitidiscaviarum]SUA77983.1 H+ Antiporter protein [Nocardia otitidiscaviarum]